MKEQWDGKSYDDTIMSPEAFARFLRRRLDQGLSVDGYNYICTKEVLDEDCGDVLGNDKKLDKIIELLEKLVPPPVTINSPITVKNEDNNVDISKHLYELANKVQRRKVTEKPKTNYSLETNISLSLMDDKGNIISKPCYRREDGCIVCESFIQETAIVG